MGEAREIWNDWDSHMHRRPSPMEIARLHATHGYDTCRERWPSVPPAVMSRMVRVGQQQIARRNEQQSG